MEEIEEKKLSKIAGGVSEQSGADISMEEKQKRYGEGLRRLMDPSRICTQQIGNCCICGKYKRTGGNSPCTECLKKGLREEIFGKESK